MNILLLTATIIPKSNQSDLKINNWEERYQEYDKALDFYIKQLRKREFDYIIFAENSAYDLTELKNKYKDKKIEWISFSGLDYDENFHRGYGEIKIIDFVYENSKVIKYSSDKDYVWKVTGRYILKNINQVIKKAPENYYIYCDVKNDWTEMSVLSWSNLAYHEVLCDLHSAFMTDKAPEFILTEYIRKWSQNRGNIFIKYNWPTYLIGKRGTSGKSYQGRLGLIRHYFRIFNAILS